MLSKTLKANERKIRWGLSLLAVFFATLAAVIVFTPKTPQPQIPSQNTSQLKLADATVYLDKAETNAQRVRGLSGRASLAPNTGMLFIFEAATEQCFWMKDMNFSIDMLWLDNDKRVIQIKPDVSPDTYPSSFCADNTRYVIELPSGDAARHKITVGQQLQF